MQYMIASDIDGTFIDHHDYQFTKAYDCFKNVTNAGIAVVFITSKTAAEVQALHQQLNYQGLAIVENGAAIISTLETAPCSNAQRVNGCWHIPLTAPMSSDSPVTDLCRTFSQLLHPFSRLNIEHVVELTGLNRANAQLAKTRLYSDPIHFVGSDEQYASIKTFAQQQGLSISRGGRFIHVGKQADKGLAMQYLLQDSNLLAQIGINFMQPLHTIGLGDGENDVPFLKQCTQAVVVRSPSHLPPSFSHSNRTVTGAFGPNGWAEALHNLCPTIGSNHG